MLSKNEVKFIQSLCHKKIRQEEKLFVVEGVKLVEELIQSAYLIKKIYATEEWGSSDKIKNVPITNVSEEELKRISNLQSPQQVLAIVAQKTHTNAIQFKNNLTIVLDGIQDPGNLGTIIRIADWFGIEQILCSEDTVELYNPKVIQSTMGSFIRLNITYGSVAEELQKANVPIYGALLSGENVYNVGKITEGVLLIGSEGKGISKEFISLITHPITIPKIGGAESLNAAVATGIILSHIV